jgi:ribosomal protein S18 acetylase RimI-like enzyme
LDTQIAGPPRLSPAADAELAAVAALVNSAYRGESARQGWTSEADFLEGVRTDAAGLRSDLAAKPEACLLALRDDAEGALLGSVWLEPAGGETWYLGMLAVRPDLQDRRLGRELLAAAEAFVRARGARRVRMTVIGIRHSLIAWYQRRGYVLTGEILPFTYDAVPRPDLDFVVLEKTI